MSWLLSTLTGGLIGGGGRSSTGGTETNSNADRDSNTNTTTNDIFSSSSSSSASIDTPQDYSSLNVGNLTEVCRASIIFSIFNPPPHPITVKSNHALMVIVRDDNRIPYQRLLHIYLTPRTPVIIQPITGALWRDVDPAHHILLFGVLVNNQRMLFHCQFKDPKEEQQINLEWSIAVWEHQQQDSYEKQIKDTKWIDPLVEEEKYAAIANTTIEKKPEDDFDFMDIDEDNITEEEEEEDEEDNEPEVSARHGTPIRGFKSSRRPRTLRRSSGKRIGNDKLAVGIAVNRTYVGRGPDLGVFKYSDDGDLQYLTAISNVKTKSGAIINPTQMMLHEQDAKMVMLNADDQTKVFEMDIERGCIVNEYGTEHLNIRSVGHISKYAEKTADPMLLGVSNNSVFSLDPRVSGKNQIAQEKTYATPMKMSSLISTGSGAVAVGSDKGEIRLYNDISKIAKTRLPGTGDPIIGLDVTNDGEWLLATTKYYLLLINTVITDDQNHTIHGWNKSLTAHAAPPIKLQLSAQHMATYNITDDYSFTTAHFNTGENIREEWIVSSLGPYIITWNFRRIKQNPIKYKYDYKIKRCVEDVVAEQFRYGQKDQVVVTLPDNVYMEHKRIPSSSTGSNNTT